MAREDFRYTVADESRFCYYTRYSMTGEGYYYPPKEAWDLCCPKCGEDRIAILEEADGTKMHLDDVAQCWMCKHVFKVTENCWKWRKTKN
jgi:hypothetical protein